MNLWQAIAYIAARTKWPVEELIDADPIIVAAVGCVVSAIEARGDEEMYAAFRVYRDWKNNRFVKAA